jgi:hypothetical protein
MVAISSDGGFVGSMHYVTQTTQPHGECSRNAGSRVRACCGAILSFRTYVRVSPATFSAMCESSGEDAAQHGVGADEVRAGKELRPSQLV